MVTYVEFWFLVIEIHVVFHFIIWNSPLNNQLKPLTLVDHMAGDAEGAAAVAHNQFIVAVTIGIMAGPASNFSVKEINPLIHFISRPQVGFAPMAESGFFIRNTDGVFPGQIRTWKVAPMIPASGIDGYR